MATDDSIASGQLALQFDGFVTPESDGWQPITQVVVEEPRDAQLEAFVEVDFTVRDDDFDMVMSLLAPQEDDLVRFGSVELLELDFQALLESAPMTLDLATDFAGGPENSPVGAEHSSFVNTSANLDFADITIVIDDGGTDSVAI